MIFNKQILIYFDGFFFLNIIVCYFYTCSQNWPFEDDQNVLVARADDDFDALFSVNVAILWKETIHARLQFKMKENKSSEFTITNALQTTSIYS